MNLTEEQRLELINSIMNVYSKCYKYVDESLQNRIHCIKNTYSYDSFRIVDNQGLTSGGSLTIPLLAKYIDKKTFNLIRQYDNNFGVLTDNKLIVCNWKDGLACIELGNIDISEHGYFSLSCISTYTKKSSKKLSFEEFKEITKKIKTK